MPPLTNRKPSPRLGARLRALCLAMLLSSAAWAAAPRWADLPASSQAVIGGALKGGERAFNALPDDKRQALARGAERWTQMNTSQRQGAQAQYQQYQQLSDAQRTQALSEREAFRQLPEAEQRALLERRKAFKARSAAEQQQERAAYERELRRRQRDLVGPGTSSGGVTTGPGGSSGATHSQDLPRGGSVTVITPVVTVGVGAELAPKP